MSSQVGCSRPPGQDAAQARARSYQLEMLGESMRENIIVAMDTGSGKTYIAVLRIMTELECCPPEKLVWFLAPTVALCTQQHEVISSQVPAARTRLLIGSDNVDRWSEQRIWDVALKDVQIVVSTHAVLADALSHGFVGMWKLALLIFDEAHHCARGHPANKIMRDFYHPTIREQGRHGVPHILGLTASPIVRSKLSELPTIEANLDSITRTPRLQRQELLKYVHRPVLIKLTYPPPPDETWHCSSRALQGLISICMSMDIQQDPYILKLKAEPQSSWKLRKLLLSGKTYCAEQLNKFCNKARHIYDELGQWAADYFIAESIRKLQKTVDINEEISFGLENDEKAYLLGILTQVPRTEQRPDLTTVDYLQISTKVNSLISFLTKEEHGKFSGLIFVRQRATVSVMSKLLSTHPKTRDRFRCAPYVGLSNSANRKQNIGELLDPRDQSRTLDDFRQGRTNLIIATDVLEEGIDITACHLVICFDKPPNLKSFIQRRGRARQEKSTFAIMLADDDVSASLNSWQELEEEMLRVYQNDARLLQEVSDLENIQEDVEDEFRIESTGALLTAESAVAHLYHFCAMLPHQRYVDLRPAFTFAEDAETHRINGTAILPNSISTSVRCTNGRKWWRTERAARKDAAFQAYVALYEAGLVNNNLLPLNREGAVVRDAREELPSTMEVSEQLNPWVGLAKAWAYPEPNQTIISIQKQDGDEAVMILTTPLAIPCIRPFTLYWDSKTTFEVRPGTSQQVAAIRSESLRFMQDIMHTLLRSTHSDQRPDNRKDFVTLFTPNIHEQQFETWLSVNRGRRLALEGFHLNPGIPPRGLVRSSLYFGIPHIFHRWRAQPSEGAETQVEVECFPLPKRRNFLEAGTLSENSTDLARGEWSENPPGEVRSFLAKTCTVDLLPIEQARFSLFIPAITQRIEVVMVANQLCQTILKNVPFRDIHHVLTAISASSTQSTTNYQRYEFLGDSILKFIVSTQLFVDHENWHEGYLSEGRAILVSNSRLARAALDAGLDSFILTKPFAGKRWAYPLVSELENHSVGKRTISSKTLADVVEALIGAAFLDGGLSAARGCTHTFLPDIRTPSLVFGSGAHARSAKLVNSSINMMAELLIDHQFLDKALLQEALTHPSCERDTLTESYQRLEFLGDAVLDMIIVTAIFEENPNCSHGSMSQIKAALVNADLLAFLCLEVSVMQDAVHIQQKGERTFDEVHEEEKIELWKFMRRHGREITEAQQACVKRHQQLRRDIERCLKYDRLYPWALLAQLDAEKFFSDIIESVFGAIFVDTGGTLADCQRFAERIGIMPYLRRIMSDGIDVVHPKASLERLTGPDKIEYIVGLEESDSHVYQCLIKINNIEVVTVGGCLTKDEAVMRAADGAAKLISRTKPQATGTPSQHM